MIKIILLKLSLGIMLTGGIGHTQLAKDQEEINKSLDRLMTTIENSYNQDITL